MIKNFLIFAIVAAVYVANAASLYAIDEEGMQYKYCVGIWSRIFNPPRKMTFSSDSGLEESYKISVKLSFFPIGRSDGHFCWRLKISHKPTSNPAWKPRLFDKKGKPIVLDKILFVPDTTAVKAKQTQIYKAGGNKEKEFYRTATESFNPEYETTKAPVNVKLPSYEEFRRANITRSLNYEGFEYRDFTAYCGNNICGDVYFATDVSTGMRVVIKHPKTGNPPTQEVKQKEYEMEKRILSSLGRLVRAHDSKLVLVQTLITGETLLQRMSKVVKNFEQEYYILRNAAKQAINDFNARGFRHNDAHLDNIMVTNEGKGVMIDFGRASIDGSANEEAQVIKQFEMIWWSSLTLPWHLTIGGKVFKRKLEFMKSLFDLICLPLVCFAKFLQGELFGPGSIKVYANDVITGKDVLIYKNFRNFEETIKVSRHFSTKVSTSGFRKDLRVFEKLGRLILVDEIGENIVAHDSIGQSLYSFYLDRKDKVLTAKYWREAVSEMHSKGIFINDITSYNILIGKDGRGHIKDVFESLYLPDWLTSAEHDQIKLEQERQISEAALKHFLDDPQAFFRRPYKLLSQAPELLPEKPVIEVLN